MDQKTRTTVTLEQYARAMRLKEIPPYIHRLLKRKENALNLIVENTGILLDLLHEILDMVKTATVSPSFITFWQTPTRR